MPIHDASTAEILVFSYKDGVLSRVAHDLMIRATRFTVEEDSTALRATVEAGRLSVVQAMNGGSLTAANVSEIEDKMRTEVLDSARWPQITFASTSVDDASIVGQLSLRGVTRQVRWTRRGRTAELRLDQRDFGIRPFTAMLGALRIKPELRVRVTVPARTG